MKRSRTGYVTERWKMQLKFDSIVASEHDFGHRHSVFLMGHGDTTRSMIIFDGLLKTALHILILMKPIWWFYVTKYVQYKVTMYLNTDVP